MSDHWMEDLVRQAVHRHLDDPLELPNLNVAIKSNRRATVVAVAIASVVAATVGTVWLAGSVRPSRESTAHRPQETTPSETRTVRLSGAGKWPAPGIVGSVVVDDHLVGIATAQGADEGSLVSVGADGYRSLAIAPASSPVAPQLLAADGKSIFAASATIARQSDAQNKLWAVDPSSMTLIAQTVLPAAPVAMTAAPGHLYVADATDVRAIDPISLQQQHVMRLESNDAAQPAGATSVLGLAAAGQRVYVSYRQGGRKRVAILTSDLERIQQFMLPDDATGVMAASDCGAWITTGQGVRQITTEGVGALIDVGQSISAIAADCDAVYSLTDDAQGLSPRLTAIASDGRISSRYSLDPDSGVGLVLSGRFVWSGGDTVQKVHIAS